MQNLLALCSLQVLGALVSRSPKLLQHALDAGIAIPILNTINTLAPRLVRPHPGSTSHPAVHATPAEKQATVLAAAAVLQLLKAVLHGMPGGLTAGSNKSAGWSVLLLSLSGQQQQWWVQQQRRQRQWVQQQQEWRGWPQMKMGLMGLIGHHMLRGGLWGDSEGVLMQLMDCCMEQLRHAPNGDEDSEDEGDDEGVVYDFKYEKDDGSKGGCLVGGGTRGSSSSNGRRSMGGKNSAQTAESGRAAAASSGAGASRRPGQVSSSGKSCATCGKVGSGNGGATVC